MDSIVLATGFEPNAFWTPLNALSPLGFRTFLICLLMVATVYAGVMVQ